MMYRLLKHPEFADFIKVIETTDDDLMKHEWYWENDYERYLETLSEHFKLELLTVPDNTFLVPLVLSIDMEETYSLFVNEFKRVIIKGELETCVESDNIHDILNYLEKLKVFQELLR